MLRKIFLLPLFLIYLLNKRLNKLRHEFQIFMLKRDNPTLRLGSNVIIRNPSRLKLGKNVNIGDNVFIHCGGMDWCNYKGGVEIGDNVKIGNDTIIWGTGANVIIGNDVTFGQSIQVYASTEFPNPDPKFNGRRTYYKFGQVNIEDGVGIYSQAIIGTGITLGAYSRINAQSVVINNVEPFTMVAGNPAKFTKNLGRKRNNSTEA